MKMVLCIQQRSLALVGSLDGKDAIWPCSKTLEQKLYDKGFVFAGILEDIDRMSCPESTSRPVSGLFSLPGRCQALNSELGTWLKELLEVAEAKHTWRAFLPQLRNESQEPIVFPDLRLAHLLVCFWALRMVVTLVLASLSKSYPQAKEKATPGTATRIPNAASTEIPQSTGASQSVGKIPPAKELFATTMQLADLILRAMPYCTSDEVGLASCFRSLFGLRGVLGVMRLNTQYTEKLRTCQAMIARLTEERGVCFAADIARLSGRWGDTKEAYPT